MPLVQFEIVINLLPTSDSFYADGDDIKVIVGLKHSLDYYWVGNVSVTASHSDLVHEDDQVIGTLLHHSLLSISIHIVTDKFSRLQKRTCVTRWVTKLRYTLKQRLS